jgi:hypothetical protein
MDTAAPNSNHFTLRAVDMVQDGAASCDWAAEERTGSTYVYHLDRSDAACTLTIGFTEGISLDIVTKRASAAAITAFHWPPSVTESPRTPATRRVVMMPARQPFNLREWLVPPVLAPVLGLLITAAVIVQR